MKYLKFMAYNSVENASRNRRELKAAAQFGFDTYCYSGDRVPPENTKGEPFEVIVNTAPDVPLSVKPKLWRWSKLLANCMRHANKIKRMHMDVISCHNVKALAIAYWAYLFTPKSRKPKLIYDSHEVELRKRDRRKLAYLCVRALEGFLIKRAAFTIIPCDTPADFLKETYILKDRPVVIKSVPDYWELDDERIAVRRKELRASLKMPEDALLTVYSGYLTESRGLEEIIDAMAIKKDMYAVWVGSPLKEEYEKRLMQRAEAAGVTERLLRVPLVSQDSLWEYVGAADVSVVVMDHIKNANYITALPNKFFEAIQSLTPVICSDSVEMQPIVERYGIGLIIPPENAEALAEAVETMQTDSASYTKFKEGLRKAKKQLCWENEKNVLMDAFRRYLQGEGMD